MGYVCEIERRCTADVQKIVREIPATIVREEQLAVKQRKLNVAAYGRVSTLNEEQLSSYNAQIAHFVGMINNNPDWKLAGIFADEGISGTSAKKRPEFMKMIELCKQGKINLILTKSISRFARNTVDALYYVRQLKNMGIGVIFENENINTLEMSSEMILTVLSALAQAESENISKAVSAGKRYAMAQGHAPFRYTNFIGYKKGSDGNPEIDPQGAETVRLIYRRFIEGATYQMIQDELEQAKILSPSGKSKWSKEVIRSILTNEKYKGDVLLQKTYVVDCISKQVRKNNGEHKQYYIENNHPPIIEREVFDRVQELIASRTKKRNAVEQRGIKSKYNTKYALSSLLVCGDCQSRYRRLIYPQYPIGDERRFVWRCLGKMENGKKFCDGPAILEAQVQRAVVRALNAYKSSTDRIHTAVKTCIAAAFGEKEETELQMLRTAIAEWNQKTMDLIARSVKSQGEQAVLDKKVQSIYRKIKALREELEEKERIQHMAQMKKREVEELFKVLDGMKGEMTVFRDEIVRHVVQKIRVDSKQQITILFKDGTKSVQQLEDAR